MMVPLQHRLELTALAVFEHVIIRFATEVTWHRRLLDSVDTFGEVEAPNHEAGD
ncbi:hypothetical protein [Cryobacterium sp. PH31-L1]|uniref:hypothetical protein n=1 Tax=Cryobacterium sp. PH31-L1 TaxID=3046199 RepID=UPI0024B8F188|nr:hypothetical protein [Cryobacterium sp. PH31-L1]